MFNNPCNWAQTCVRTPLYINTDQLPAHVRLSHPPPADCCEWGLKASINPSQSGEPGKDLTTSGRLHIKVQCAKCAARAMHTLPNHSSQHQLLSYLATKTAAPLV